MSKKDVVAAVVAESCPITHIFSALSISMRLLLNRQRSEPEVTAFETTAMIQINVGCGIWFLQIDGRIVRQFLNNCLG